MTRETFDRHLKQIQDDILVLGSMVEGAITDSVQVLKGRDSLGSQRLIEYDKRVNEKRFAIESEILTLIATQQPVATDVRLLAAGLEIITELERIGDYAKGIAVINLKMGDAPLIKPLIDIPTMAEKASELLGRALDAFVQQDVEAARTIGMEDDVIDELYNQVYRDLIDMMTHTPTVFDQATYLLWVAHNLERSGDRVVNICERIIFTVTGEMVEISGSLEKEPA